MALGKVSISSYIDEYSTEIKTLSFQNIVHFCVILNREI